MLITMRNPSNFIVLLILDYFSIENLTRLVLYFH